MHLQRFAGQPQKGNYPLLTCFGYFSAGDRHRRHNKKNQTSHLGELRGYLDWWRGGSSKTWAWKIAMFGIVSRETTRNKPNTLCNYLSSKKTII